MGNLQQYREAQPDRRLLPMCVRLILNQSLQALQYLHDLGIMHRDIKLGNILVATEEPLIKLADIGLSSLQNVFSGLAIVIPSQSSSNQSHLIPPPPSPSSIHPASVT